MWNVSFSRACYSPFLAIFSYDWSHTIFPSFCVSSFTSLSHWRIWSFRQKLEGWVHMWTFRMKRKTERNAASVCCRHFTAISVGCHSLCRSSTTSPSTDPLHCFPQWLCNALRINAGCLLLENIFAKVKGLLIYLQEWHYYYDDDAEAWEHILITGIVLANNS